MLGFTIFLLILNISLIWITIFQWDEKDTKKNILLILTILIFSLNDVMQIFWIKG